LTVDLFKGNTGTVSVRLTPESDLLVAGEIELKNLSPFGDGYNFEKQILKFPRIVIPLAGIPGVSISAFIDGGVFFKFSWQPLILKQLKVGFAETNINEIENVTLDIHGSVGSMASAEVYMTINAGLEARVLVATLSGSIGGEAGLGISAEAGGELDASWNMQKGLQFKEVRAFLNVTPKAVFRLTGSISIDLDLWITTINLYYHKWVFAEKELDLSGLTLKLDFPIRFNEDNTVKMPTYEEMNVQKPDFTGSQGEAILDKAINGDAEKELEAKKQEIRSQIKHDLREKSYDPEFSLSNYTEKMVDKYGKSEELKTFVLQVIEDESRNLEYERFERNKSMIRSSPMPLNSKLTILNIFSMFNQYVTNNDVEAFKAELITIEEEKKLKAQQSTAAMPPPPIDNQSSSTNGTAQTKLFDNGKPDVNTLQSKAIFESDAESSEEESIQRKCSECEEENQIQRNETTDASVWPDDKLTNSIQHKVEADIQREPDTDPAPTEPLPFTPDPKSEILPPQPTPGSTQKPDRSDTLSVKGLWWFHAQPIEEGMKKLHPERRFEYEDSIFFDFDSAILPDIEKELKIDRDLTDPKNPGGWLARADKKKIKIILRGNASEEGNPAYNLSLSNKRIKAVANALKHPNIIIVKQESIFGKDKTIDFRRARRVDIVEEGVSAPAATPGDCGPTLKRIMGVKSRSITFLDKASLNVLKALRSPSDKDSVKTRSIVAKWFNKSDVRVMTAVAQGLSQISKTLDELDPAKANLTCEVTGKPPVQNCSEGVGARGGNDPRPSIIICSSMEKSDENELIDLFIHESGHAAGFMKDFAYAHERAFRVVDTESRLKMPDGFVGVTLEINSAVENADVEVPTIGKNDEVDCLKTQTNRALDALGLVDRWINDAQDSVRELYDKSNPDFMADHVATVKAHFDSDYNDKKIKVTEALYARFEEMSFPLRGDLKIICMNDFLDTTGLGGFWQEDSSGFPGEKIFLLPEFFTLATDAEKGALLMAEMLAKASGFIEPRHRKAFAKMAQSFSKTQDKNPWRKKD
jgi:outer membrane protein OmpA-like peptidoglycan-associated protein